MFERAIGRNLRRRCRRYRSRRSDDGFTLIELLVVISIIPLVMGAISVALIAVIQQQNTVSDKVSNSGDETVVSATYVKDVQSGQYITTSTNPASATYPWNPCVTSSPIVSLVWPTTNTVVVSYAAVRQANSSYYSLYRYYCLQGASPTTQTSVVAHNVKVVPTAVISGSSCQNLQCNPLGARDAAANGWTPTAGISSVVLTVQAPERTGGGTGTYQFRLTAVPRASTSASRGTSAGGHAPLLMLGTGSPDVTCTGHDSLAVNGIASVDSSTNPAIVTNGTASVSATSIFTDSPTSSGAFSGSNISPSTPTATGVVTQDPYFGLMPPATGLPIANTYHDGDTYQGFTVRTHGAYEGPGLYTNGLIITSAQQLASGIYVIEANNQGIGLQLSGNGAVTSAPGGVLIYVFSGTASITGNGGINLQPLPSPPSPAPGLSLWVDRSDTSAVTLGGNGAAIVIGGTVYAPNSSVAAGGNGSLDVGSLVSGSVTCNGGGNAGSITIG
jgi:prepilin-type N-terminal cleavage/methylation domain-containing protein